MITVLIEYGENVTEGAKLFAAFNHALTGAMPDPFDILDDVLMDNGVILTLEQTSARDAYEAVFDNFKVGTDHFVQLTHNTEAKTIELTIGKSVEDNAILRTSIRADYTSEQTEENESVESEAPVEASQMEEEPKLLNDKIEQILDSDNPSEIEPPEVMTGSDEPSDECIMLPQEEEVVPIPDEVSNSSFDEDGTPEVELPSDVGIESGGEFRLAE